MTAGQIAIACPRHPESRGCLFALSSARRSTRLTLSILRAWSTMRMVTHAALLRISQFASKPVNLPSPIACCTLR